MSQIAKAAERWGNVPDWVRVLADHADRHGLRGAEEKVGYSRSTLSQVLSNTYPGDLSKIEARVRGALLAETVVCPRKGTMGRHVCIDWQNKPFYATSADRVAMFRACRSGCPHSKHTKETVDA